MKTQPTEIFDLFATTPKGLELLLVDELRALGAEQPAEKLAGVSFKGSLAMAYKACLWSRLANRILLTLAKFPASTPEELYAGIQSIAWDQHLDPEGTLAVNFVVNQSKINHTLFGAQKVKDAIVDQFRDKFGTRPNVDKERPDVSIYVYLYRDFAAVSLDLSGDSLHKRGYRLSTGAAPLKENLAAAILIRSGWPAIAKAGGSLMDPMCGSGTLLVEAAMMAGDIAPGLERPYFGFWGWKKHEAGIWQDLVEEAEKKREQAYENLPIIIGYDQDPAAITVAIENIERAGMRGNIHVEKRELAEFEPRANIKPGLVATNPPYGERLGELDELQPLYTLLGERLKAGFTGWQASVFTGNPDLGKVMGVRAKHYYALFNGTIPCKLLTFDLQPAFYIDRSPAAENERRIRYAQKTLTDADKEAVQMFINRLNKNLKHLGKQAANQGLTSYRVYDADLPEYAVAIDISPESIQVTEYQAPRSIDADKAVRRQQAVLAVLPEVLNVPSAQIFFNVLQRERKIRE
ncbi:MAG: bifunctional 23S rRNA (guanine(2069)-N(7))-methyltransferase RlmK/23S rRNA (guanine(2445)-N(2))-methyltransferase RlmL [Gammaproteobacteria bacterium]